MTCEGKLLELIGALHASRRFPGSLNCRQKKGDEHSDNRNDDEKFDERETSLA
jgi:hypothetical protein